MDRKCVPGPKVIFPGENVVLADWFPGLGSASSVTADSPMTVSVCDRSIGRTGVESRRVRRCIGRLSLSSSAVGDDGLVGSVCLLVASGIGRPRKTLLWSLPREMDRTKGRELKDGRRIRDLLFLRSSTTMLNFLSKAFLLICTTKADTKMADPSMIKTNRMNCWNVFKADRLTVLSPAKVIALTHRNRLSVKLTLRAGVEDPQKMMALRREVPIKYA